MPPITRINVVFTRPAAVVQLIICNSGNERGYVLTNKAKLPQLNWKKAVLLGCWGKIETFLEKWNFESEMMLITCVGFEISPFMEGSISNCPTRQER